MFVSSVLIFTDVNKMRFNFVNTVKPCGKKDEASEKAFTSWVLALTSLLFGEIICWQWNYPRAST